MNRSLRRKYCSVPLALSWSHEGVLYRITPWPEVRVERCFEQEWIAVGVLADVAAAARTIDEADWCAYLEFVPAEVCEFLGHFRQNRLGALQVAARCPALVDTLTEIPALTAFVATHPMLRGGIAWDELNAVHERGGVFSVLEWLGLPASRQTLAILRNLATADFPARLVAPLRSTLWDPQAIFSLAKLPEISDRELTEACYGLAA